MLNKSNTQPNNIPAVSNWQNEQVSAYRSVKITQNHKPRTLKSALDYIRSDGLKPQIEALRSTDDKAQQKQLKQQLPAVSFSGLFEPNQSVKNDTFKQASGIFLVDIDGLADVSATKALLSDQAWIAFAFVSPSGNGLKAGVLVDAERIESDPDFKQAYLQIEPAFKALGVEIDAACTDIRRACYLSHDADIYTNEAAVEFELAPFEVIAPKLAKPIKRTEYKANDEEGRLIDMCCNILHDAAAGGYHEARLRTGRLMGGFVGAGRLPQSAFSELDQVSRSYHSKGSYETERRTLAQAFENGKAQPIYPDEKYNKPQSSAAPIKLERPTEYKHDLVNFIGEKTGFIAADDTAYLFSDKQSVGFFKKAHEIKGGESLRGWITTAKDYPQLAEGLKALGQHCHIYVVADVHSANEVARFLHDQNIPINLFMADVSPEWHYFACKQRMAFIHTGLKSIKSKLHKFDDALLIATLLRGMTGHDEKREGLLIARNSAFQKYQNYLLGGELDPIAYAALGYQREYFEAKYPNLKQQIMELALKSGNLSKYEAVSFSVDCKLSKILLTPSNLPRKNLSTDVLSKGGVFVLDQNEGSGKSEIVGDYLSIVTGSNQRVLTITPSEALTHDSAEKNGQTNYKDTAAIQSGGHFNTLATCINSILRADVSAYADDADIVMLDEAMTIANALGTGSHIAEYKRKPLYDKLAQIIRGADVVFLCDANMNAAGLEFFKSIRSDIVALDFEYDKFKKADVIFHDTQHSILKELSAAIDEDSGCIVVISDSIKTIEMIEQYVVTNHPHIGREDIALLHGENKAGDAFRSYDNEFFRDINGQTAKYKLLIASPVIGTGVSLTDNTSSKTFCFFSGRLPIAQYCQYIHRNRPATELHIHFDLNCDSNSTLNHCINPSPLDQFNIAEHEQNQLRADEKLELFIRALKTKGFTNISWCHDSGEIEGLSDIRKAATDNWLDGLKNAGDDALENKAIRDQLKNASRTTQKESHQLRRYWWQLLYAESPDILPSKKHSVENHAHMFIKNLEILRTDKATLKRLDHEDQAIDSRKGHYVIKREFLRIISRCESPSKTVLTNVLRELVASPEQYQRFCTIDLKRLQGQFNAGKNINLLMLTNKLLADNLNLRITRTNDGLAAVRKYDYDFNLADKRRAENGLSLLEFSAEKEEIFLNFFEKKVSEKSPEIRVTMRCAEQIEENRNPYITTAVINPDQQAAQNRVQTHSPN